MRQHYPLGDRTRVASDAHYIPVPVPLRPLMSETTRMTRNTKKRILAASIATPDKPNIPKALASKAITRKIKAYRNMMTSFSTCEW